jgi:putative phosphotransacetylase
MTGEELDRLAALIADALAKPPVARGPADPQPARRPGRPAASWVPAPVRPEPPQRGGEPAPWTGAGQSLGDVAPIRHRSASRHRTDPGELAAAVRAAAAGKAPPVARSAPARTEPAGRRRIREMPVTVKIGVSNRHIHLSAGDQRRLFGGAELTAARPLLQPGQFAATQTVAVAGPKGRIDAVRIVGPARGDTQVELARSDAALLGVEPPVASSGVLDTSIGGVTLIGPHGRVDLSRGVIIAARHLHLSPADAERWGFRDGDRLVVAAGTGARSTAFHDVLVRSGPAHATELHLDVDEARAAGVVTGDPARIVEWHEGRGSRRALVTEGDVIAIAGRRERLPEHAILTPSARDRARALGLLDQ